MFLRRISTAAIRRVLPTRTSGSIHSQTPSSHIEKAPISSSHDIPQIGSYVLVERKGSNDTSPNNFLQFLGQTVTVVGSILAIGYYVIADLKTDLRGISTKMDDVKDRLARVETNQENMKASLEEIKGKVRR
eukprot:TRINITY_DN1800_c0_g1_i1.p1 TRINITY_DN1800_c0_g1~~TRINITY_DN1800_c0_g1_i1.p1  ORF type:complete len:132 (+),score=10.82 TRINITY_DN1800_c0_g1_i1:59-454(+)